MCHLGVPKPHALKNSDGTRAVPRTLTARTSRCKKDIHREARSLCIRASPCCLQEGFALKATVLAL